MIRVEKGQCRRVMLCRQCGEPIERGQVYVIHQVPTADEHVFRMWVSHLECEAARTTGGAKKALRRYAVSR